MYYDKIRLSQKLLFVLAGLMMMGSTNFYSPSVKKRYHIEEGSKLFIKGTSNVNAFTCDCGDQFNGQVIDMERSGGYARFHNVELILRAKNFDCHNRKIDADMQKALRADQYPYIKVSLIDTWQNAKCLNGECSDWFDVQAKVNVTITNATKEQSIPAKAKKTGPNRFQLRGESALQLSAFGVTPPEAMFGLIKVNDWIAFHFDLIVSVDDVQ